MIFADEEGVPQGHPQALMLVLLRFCPFFNSSHHSPIPTLENFLHTKLNTNLLAILV
jgi:hypothetical protein